MTIWFRVKISWNASVHHDQLLCVKFKDLLHYYFSKIIQTHVLWCYYTAPGDPLVDLQEKKTKQDTHYAFSTKASKISNQQHQVC